MNVVRDNDSVATIGTKACRASKMNIDD